MLDERADKPAKAGPSYPISSVDNALRLLLMFRDQKRLRLSDVATALNVAHSTAHRLLAMLIHHDFVRQEGDLRTYVTGPALLDLGLSAVRNMDIRTFARPILDDLAVKIEETVHLAQLEGGKIRYLAAAECNRPLRVADRTGQLMPAHRTATGKAMLADLTPAQLDELFPVSDAATGTGGYSRAEREALDAELAQVRELGYATNYRETEDIISMATVVRDKRGITVAALNASAPSNRMSKRRQLTVIRQLHAAAALLEDLLGNAAGS
ncbi:IclR family transcriptional regulator [Micromonospora sp. NBC_00389]|uniref:IclR family transcriptional regulator n=1 Tax=Micromonospora sp. NBC_00389 TaxID=2903586 RepID=UPI002E212E89